MLTFWQLGEVPKNNYYSNPPLKAKRIIKAIIRIRLQPRWCWLEAETYLQTFSWNLKCKDDSRPEP